MPLLTLFSSSSSFYSLSSLLFSPPPSFFPSSSRLHSKWCNAVANRREFLDSELRKLMDQKGATVTEMERQNELLDQWAMLSWQRQALLEPRAGSGLPGAPTNWWALFRTTINIRRYHKTVAEVRGTLCTKNDARALFPVGARSDKMAVRKTSIFGKVYVFSDTVVCAF